MRGLFFPGWFHFSIAAAAGLALFPHIARSQAVVSVTCSNSASDVTSINNAVAALGGDVGIVRLQPGVCAVGQTPIVLTSNVWLQGSGAGVGGTILRQSTFTNQDIIDANNAPSLTNVKISDMTIDGQDLVYLPATVPAAVQAGSSSLHFPSGAPAGLSAGMIVVDNSDPAALANNTRIQSISSDNTTVTLTAAVASPGVAAGDAVRFYTTSRTINADFISGLTIDHVYLVRTSGMTAMTILGDQDFVISNDLISVTNPDPQATGTLLLDARTSATPPWNHDGFITGNVVLNASIEIGGTDLVVSNNVITPGYGTGIVAEGMDQQYALPEAARIIFEGNTVHFSQVGLNHDNIVAGGLEIWASDALVADNIVFDNGAQGILVGGPNAQVSSNVIYDNNQSSYTPNGGDNGLDVANGANTPSNTVIVGNEICNTGTTFKFGAPVACLASQNSGSQRESIWIAGGLTGTQIAADNTILPGRADATGITGPYTTAAQVPMGSVTATSCTLPSPTGQCTSTLQWSSADATNVTLVVRNSADPSQTQVLASGGSGSATAPWITNGVFVFEVTSDQGVLASTTLQPVLAGQTQSGAAVPVPAVAGQAVASTAAAQQLPETAEIASSARTASLPSGGNAMSDADTAAMPEADEAAVTSQPQDASVSAAANVMPEFDSVEVATSAQAASLPSTASVVPASGGGSLSIHASLAMARRAAFAAKAFDMAPATAVTGSVAPGSASGWIADSAAAPYRVVTGSVGRAVLETNGEDGSGAATFTVQVGDLVPGYGRVVAIARYGARWAVVTDHGTIN
jgi:hypothetical protein